MTSTGRIAFIRRASLLPDADIGFAEMGDRARAKLEGRNA